MVSVSPYRSRYLLVCRVVGRYLFTQVVMGEGSFHTQVVEISLLPESLVERRVPIG